MGPGAHIVGGGQADTELVEEVDVEHVSPSFCCSLVRGKGVGGWR
jgi:hypothetical protein